jgi:photosystem II stability/assembly factor-like uncharacterized protein
MFENKLLPGLVFMICSAWNLAAQTAGNVWQRPGLVIGSDHVNIIDGTWNTSYRYAGDTALCGTTLLRFAPTATGVPLYLRVQGGKIEFTRSNLLDPCADFRTLYDFDLNIGDPFTTYHGLPLQVIATDNVTLLNGDTRRRVMLSGSGGSGGHVWIEGIGDVDRGLWPLYFDFEGYDRFVCARDSSGDLWFGDMAHLCDSLTCPEPQPAFDFAIDGLTLALANQSQLASESAWDFGDGQSSTEVNPVHTYAAPGCYDVRLTVKTSCLERGFSVLRTVNVGQPLNWTVLPGPAIAADEYPMDLDFPQADTGWVISTSTVWKTTDGGQNWVQQALPPEQAPAARLMQRIHMFTTQTGIIAVGNYYGSGVPNLINLFVTTDGGAHWEARSIDDGYFLVAAVLTDNGQAFASGDYTELYYSADAGQTWTEKNLPGMFLHHLDAIGGDTLYAFGVQGLLPQATFISARSTDAGTSWSLTPLGASFQSRFQSSFPTAQNGWLAAGEPFVLHTTDAMESWQTVPLHATLGLYAVDFADAAHGWAGGGQGLIVHTQDGGATWARENCGYTGSIEDLSAPAPDVAYALSSRREVLKYCPVGCTVSAPVVASPALLRVWPNPATDWIRIEPGAAGFARHDRLRVLDALGRPVAETAVEDAAGAALDVSAWPSGVYVVQLWQGGVPTASRRIICLHRE